MLKEVGSNLYRHKFGWVVAAAKWLSKVFSDRESWSKDRREDIEVKDSTELMEEMKSPSKFIMESVLSAEAVKMLTGLFSLSGEYVNWVDMILKSLLYSKMGRFSCSLNILRSQSLTTQPELLNPLWPVSMRFPVLSISQQLAKFVPVEVLNSEANSSSLIS